MRDVWQCIATRGDSELLFGGAPMIYEELTANYRNVLDSFSAYRFRLEGMKKDHDRLFQTLTAQVHGIDHWVRVALYGLFIAEHYSGPQFDFPCDKKNIGALAEPVLAAAFFHDCARTNEGAELDHGRAAEKIWRDYIERHRVDAMVGEVVAQALLYHVDHLSVDPAANLVTVCLCNGDRLDRVRLGSTIKPHLMYEDGCWRKLAAVNDRLLNDYSRRTVLADLKLL